MQDETQRVALGYASMMLVAAWQAARATGAEKVGPERVAEIERQIEAGEITLAVHIQRSGQNVRLLVGVAAPGWQDPFGGGGALDLTGPLVLSREELARLYVVQAESLN